MFIAHLPAAYLALRATRTAQYRPFSTAFLVGGVLPDIDMLWFHLLDGRQTHHHDYLTHRPMLWLALVLISALLLRGRLRWVGVGLGAGGLLHLALDSIAGRIAWLWPFSDAAAPLVTVPASHSWWVYSFLTHWTFAVEVLLCLVALVLFVTAHRR